MMLVHCSAHVMTIMMQCVAGASLVTVTQKLEDSLVVDAGSSRGVRKTVSLDSGLAVDVVEMPWSSVAIGGITPYQLSPLPARASS